ncbi:type II toxin-antitoxin system VapC family toxin [Synechococcus sp. EJ6-Ellesmere]|uniref:type II toxin-antitoxin system VapC family toxin n=1 Tax=Synechococcus sp. EJ6-Ellesmere TaxID=2823734 RepID=UPI0020CC2D12|nr:type II toxin-antitoxin system VapC family toxin [Synechococcus sp. EJ6-Ellesmere]MCP9824142.1 type II toxin-antitoxin system VapC family toxin [Synechococcus sp. EJ6-Ellesmere]
MVIETSALIAILKAEPEAKSLLVCLSQPGAKAISMATLLEAQIVVEGQLGEAGGHELDLLLSRGEIQPTPLDRLHLHWALRGWRHYGKGRHRAGLNLGDCFSYGLAMALDVPLLFKGEDFSHTDVKVAL